MMSAKTRDLLAEAADYATWYLETIHERSVFPDPADVERLQTALGLPLPEDPTDPLSVLTLINQFGSPATVASNAGRYFGFVTGASLPVCTAVNWLASAWDQNSFSYTSSPAIALFEQSALSWLKQALRLPEGASGGFVTGATMGNFTCLAAARNHVLSEVGWDVNQCGLFNAPDVTIVIGSQAHSSVRKALRLLGIGQDQIAVVPADREGRIRPDRLPEISGPTVICLQAGNVNTGACDPAKKIIPAAHEAGAWIHIDGAFGLWARACPDRAALCDSMEDADSWVTDAHKWLNVPYDCGIVLVREPGALHQAMSISNDDLSPPEFSNAIDLTPEGSRRARAIEVWAALKSLGRTGIASLILRSCLQAEKLAEKLKGIGADVLNEVVLNQIVVAFGSNENTDQVISAVQGSGACWCGGTNWQGRKALSISLSSWATTQEDVEKSFEAIASAYENIR